MSTRSVSIGSAVAAFFCLFMVAGLAIFVLLASGLTARAEEEPAEATEEPVRQIEIHTKKEEDVAQAEMADAGADYDLRGENDAWTNTDIPPDTHYESPRIILGIDRAQLMRLDGTVNTIVIGNPTIADAAVYDKSTLVLTGKAFGETNIIVLDGSGRVIREASIRVGQPNDVVVVNRGASQVTYSCAPHCSRTLRIGDDAEAFTTTATQAQTIVGMNDGTATGQ